jgi:hypothetical protein
MSEQKVIMPGVDDEAVFDPAVEQGTAPADETPVADPQAPVRARRSYFVIASSGIAYLSSMYLAIKGSGDIATKVADAMMTYLTVVVPTYILSHSVDRSEMLTKIGESFKKG